MQVVFYVATLLAVSLAQNFPPQDVQGVEPRGIIAQPRPNEQKPTLVISPSFIEPGKTQKIVLSCEYNHAEDEEDNVVSISIGAYSRDQKNVIEPLFQSHKEVGKNLSEKMHKNNATASGSVHMDKRYSAISIEWEYPTSEDARTYECSVHKQNTNGQLVKVSSEVDVLIADHNMNTLGQDLTNTVQLLRQRLSHSLLKVEAETMVYFLDLARSIGLTNERVNNVDKKVDLILKDLDNMKNIVILLGSDLEKLSQQRQGQRYYLSERKQLFNIDDGHNACSALGGHLLEINDQQELDFVFDLIKQSANPTEQYYTGAFQDEKDFQKYSFRGTGKQVDFKPWLVNNVQPSPTEKCVALVRTSESQDGQVTNKVTGTMCGMEGRYICEIPVATYNPNIRI